VTALLQTPFCDLLGIEIPILNVGFGESAGPELAAAVSNAGALGVLGFSGVPPDEIRRRIRQTRELTDRPFGGNVIIAAQQFPEYLARMEARIAVCLEERIPLLVLFWGDPAPYVEEAHRRGVRVAIQVGSAEEAARAAAAGVDAVIAQGSEAGGHVKATESLWDVLPAAVDAVHPLPVIAAGGIGGGAAIARALSLGAQGVSLGTRFVASEEAWTHRTYKERVVAASAEDTFYGELFDVGWPGAPHRALRGKTFDEWDAAGRPPSGQRPGEGEVIGIVHLPWGDEPWHRYEVGMIPPDFDGELEYAPMWAGHSVDAIHGIAPAAEIVRQLVRETYSATTYSNDAQQSSAKSTS
jgi:nitronate monooxygenase